MASIDDTGAERRAWHDPEFVKVGVSGKFARHNSSDTENTTSPTGSKERSQKVFRSINVK